MNAPHHPAALQATSVCACDHPDAATPGPDDTVLVIGHGSREEVGNQDVRDFVAQWRARRPLWRLEVGFIEFAPPALDEALRAAAATSRRVLVLPLILNAAGHVKMEIPEAIERSRADCPGTEFRYSPPLGAVAAVRDVLRRRLRHAMTALDMPDPTTTGVVLLGRGSSDPVANGEMARMARWLQEGGDHELVDLAFTGITWPRLERVVQRQHLLGMRQVVVLPYYLHNGVLIQRIERQVEHLRAQYPTMRFALGAPFGFEPEIFTLLEERVDGLLRGDLAARLACDGCLYREMAHDQGHGHSHAHTHAQTHAPAGAAAA